MPASQEPIQIDNGLYLAADLPPFDSRQSWRATLYSTNKDQTISVENNELLRLNVARQLSTPMSTRGSQVDYIQKVVREGTVEPAGLKNVPAQMRALKESLESVEPQSEILHMGYETMKVAYEAEKQFRINQRIRTIAGYIAIRENLWVVTRNFPAEPNAPRELRIGLARLVGLAMESEGAIQAVPVVSGRNKKLARLLATPGADSKNRGIKVRNVFESTKTRPRT